MYFAGIDSGSTTTKLVIIDKNQEIIYFNLLKTGFDPESRVKKLINGLTEELKIKENEIVNSVVTGYGGKRFTQFEFVTEITCHAKGTHYFFPDIHYIIDVGGQDSKAIIKNKKSKVVDFVLNDKCAAGTGRFLEVMANILNISPTDFEKLVEGINDAPRITSFCTVFAESEVISLLSNKISKNQIAYAVCHSVSEKILNFSYVLFGTKPIDKIIFSGGTALIKPVVNFLHKLSGAKIIIPNKPQITAALGAALIAKGKIL